MQSAVNAILENWRNIRESTKKLWNSSKYFRIISIATGSITGWLAMRNLYIKMYRKYNKLPDGMIGFPLIGQALGLIDPDFLIKFASNYPSMASMMIGTKNVVIFNEPHLAKKWYSDPRSVNVVLTKSELDKFSFTNTNGKAWSERRRMIYSNLMSTMKASFVEDVTRKFTKTKVFPIFDENIKNNESTKMKQLFRPIGFNIVLQSCFGKELKSLNDPYWLKWDKFQTKLMHDQQIQVLIMMMFGAGALSLYLQRLLTGDDIISELSQERDLVDEFSKLQSRNIELNDKNEDIKLFNDYMQNYLNNDDTKWTRKDLLGDMAMMFIGATDSTNSALSYSVLLAAKYQHIQDEIHKEIVDAFGHNLDNIELKNKGFTKLAKLRAFIHESLRIFPPAPAAGFRNVLDDGVVIDATKVDGNKYNLPKKTMTIINIAGIGQIAKYWIKNYDPLNNICHRDINMKEPHLDFWLDENGHFVKAKNSSSFFTFHYGKRDCVGQTLAMKELIIVLAMIFMKYKVLPMDGNTDFMIKSKFGGAFVEPTIDDIRLELRK